MSKSLLIYFSFFIFYPILNAQMYNECNKRLVSKKYLMVVNTAKQYRIVFSELQILLHGIFVSLLTGMFPEFLWNVVPEGWFAGVIRHMLPDSSEKLSVYTNTLHMPLYMLFYDFLSPVDTNSSWTFSTCKSQGVQKTVFMQANSCATSNGHQLQIWSKLQDCEDIDRSRHLHKNVSLPTIPSKQIAKACKYLFKDAKHMWVWFPSS